MKQGIAKEKRANTRYSLLRSGTDKKKKKLWSQKEGTG